MFLQLVWNLLCSPGFERLPDSPSVGGRGMHHPGLEKWRLFDQECSPEVEHFPSMCESLCSTSTPEKEKVGSASETHVTSKRKSGVLLCLPGQHH